MHGLAAGATAERHDQASKSCARANSGASGSMVRGRLRVGEVPIAFDDRRRGESKLGWRQRLDYLRHLGRLVGR